MAGPLDGVRVLEVAIYAFVPSATAILADWGADVLKVEHPVLGDPGRNTSAWGVPGRGRRRVPPLGGGQPRQAGDDPRHRHPRGQGRSCCSWSTSPTCSSPTSCRRPAASSGSNPRTSWAATRGSSTPGAAPRDRAASVRARRVRRHLLLGPHRRRASASPRPRPTCPWPCPVPASATSSPASPWPVASPPRCTSASGPAAASSSTSRSCRWASGPWG